jgi:probable HAF family extracellular repeat protein
MVGLGFLAGGVTSDAYGVSSDGAVVVGDSSNGSVSHAFRWTSGTGMAGLGVLPGYTNSAAVAISADGSTIIGTSWASGVSQEGFRWTASGGMVGLGVLPGGAAPNAVSANGSTIVGGANNLYNSSNGFIWDSAHGAQDLRTYLTSLGLNLTGWTNLDAYGVSADGQTIVGVGTDLGGQAEAWIAVIPEPRTSVLVMVGMLGLAVVRRTKGVSAQLRLRRHLGLHSARHIRLRFAALQ